MKTLWLLASSITCLTAQPWSGIIDPSRAVDWSTAGVQGGIPSGSWTQCGSTIAAYGSSGTPASPSTINTQVSGCSANQFVLLGAGTFYLNNPIVIPNSTVVRGLGANQTFIVFSATSGCNGLQPLICMTGANSGVNSENNVCDFTSGYSQGSTTITLSNCGSTTPAAGSIANLKVGFPIILDQLDEANDTGQVWNCVDPKCANDGASGGERTDGTCNGMECYREQQQVVQVTQCDSITTPGHVCASGTNITISPGLYMANWNNAGQKPQAWWANSYANNAGVENLSIDTGGGTFPTWSIAILNAYNVWIKGVRSLNAERAHVVLAGCWHCEVRDSYFYQNNAHGSQSYCIEMIATSNSKIENTIMQQCTDSTPNNTGGIEGNVIAYNFAINDIFTLTTGWFQDSFYLHSGGDALNLYEGNIGPGYGADAEHGTHHLETHFRNFFTGWQPICNGAACTQATIPYIGQASSRYWNAIANVLGTPGYHTNYQCVALSTATCSAINTSIWSLGYTGLGTPFGSGQTGFCTSPSCASTDGYDPQTPNYMYRWGNWDSVNATTQWNTAEVPTALAAYSNAVPTSSCTSLLACPSSFYLTSKPSWWGSSPWPGIGPEISGGNVGQCSGGTYAMVPATSGLCSGGSLTTSAYSGHVNANPAMQCAMSVMNMPPDGTGAALGFNSAACYNIFVSGTSISGPISMSGNISHQ